MAVAEMALPVLAGTVEKNIAGKTPHNRLLDMLAGWSAFVEKDEEQGFGDAPGINDKVYELYQEAGALGLDERNPVDENAEETLRAFLMTRILSVLLQSDYNSKQ